MGSTRALSVVQHMLPACRFQRSRSGLLLLGLSPSRSFFHNPSPLAVFRDDIVFLVQLYQRWIYRVDRTRTNEFG